ncbi:DUF3310 domain-containing protein [Veillonella criceti]|uniref:Protein of unknwon function (DUF3310) n=1 Tax=Veillonella criceti TaxID=103891 RepID=A0A380NL31_9FIRM|nr:DUF3310 domain-containing protein [Veillonella criceti]SUP42285.1 Protein of unknwon function (DUF3310) [Veillonella criceti]
MYEYDVLDIIDMIIDCDKLPNNGQTLKLRRAIRSLSDDITLGLKDHKETLSKAVKDYYQYYLNCNNHAIAQNKANEDMVHNPSHYKLRGLDIESVDVIESVLSDEEYRGWCKGNALKYLFRAGKKDDELQDLRKCDVYVNWAIKAMEGVR